MAGKSKLKVMNESKLRDPRMWERWKKSGALGNIEDAKIAKAREMGPLKLIGFSEHHIGLTAGKSILSLGEIAVGVIDIGHNNKIPIIKPVINVIVPGHAYGSRLREMIEIPRRAEPVSRYYP